MIYYRGEGLCFSSVPFSWGLYTRRDGVRKNSRGLQSGAAWIDSLSIISCVHFFHFFNFFFLLDHSPFQLWLASQPAGCLVPAIKGLLFLSRYTITLHCRGAARREKREGRVGGERGVNGQWAMGDGLGREVGRQGLIGGAKGKEGQHALCGMSTVYSIYRRRYNHHHGWACNYPLGLACEDRIRSGRV